MIFRIFLINYIFCYFFRCQELEAELQKLKMECDVLRTKSSHGDTAAPMTSSVAKVVQPTATVSSVPVSGPSKFFVNFH